MTTIPAVAKLALVVLIILALAELAPEWINAFLGLVLVGVILSHWQNFSGLASALGTLGK